MDEIQATFAAQAEAAKEFQLKQLALQYPAVRELLEEASALRAKLASKKAK
jgi:hypothetical protein